MATILYGVEVPSGRRRHAVRQRHDGLRCAAGRRTRNRIDKLNAIHSVEHSRRDGGVALATEYELKKAPPVRHPLARPHPATGKKAIYCGCHAWKVEGFRDDEGRELLDYLIGFAVQERFVYRAQVAPARPAACGTTAACSTRQPITTRRRSCACCIARSWKATRPCR